MSLSSEGLEPPPPQLATLCFHHCRHCNHRLEVWAPLPLLLLHSFKALLLSAAYKPTPTPSFPTSNTESLTVTITAIIKTLMPISIYSFCSPARPSYLDRDDIISAPSHCRCSLTVFNCEQQNEPRLKLVTVLELVAGRVLFRGQTDLEFVKSFKLWKYMQRVFSSACAHNLLYLWLDIRYPIFLKSKRILKMC